MNKIFVYIKTIKEVYNIIHLCYVGKKGSRIIKINNFGVVDKKCSVPLL